MHEQAAELLRRVWCAAKSGMPISADLTQQCFEFAASAENKTPDEISRDWYSRVSGTRPSQERINAEVLAKQIGPVVPKGVKWVPTR
jgi:hypothetical protein